MRFNSTPPAPLEQWAIVLAAGDGTRLRGLTTDRNGNTIPKQFCSLRGGRTLLQDALRRAARVVRPDRVVVVVAERHRRWWEREVVSLPCRNIVVQPDNRGTACGILLPLFSILQRDHAAQVAVFPSDHAVREEFVLERTMRATLRELCGDELVLLGIPPEYAEADYGWVVPAADGTSHVAAFVEKPNPAEAEACLRRGALWNSFIFAARGSAMLALCDRRVPSLTAAFRTAFASSVRGRTRAVARLYQSLDLVDFSRAVLQGSEPFLRLRVVPTCGWTDLGTPARVAKCLDGLRAVRSRGPGSKELLDLSEAVARFRNAKTDEHAAVE